MHKSHLANDFDMNVNTLCLRLSLKPPVGGACLAEHRSNLVLLPVMYYSGIGTEVGRF